MIKLKTFRKKEIIEIAKYACKHLEEGRKDIFFDQIEILLVSKIPFGKLKLLGEYMGKRGLDRPGIYFRCFG